MLIPTDLATRYLELLKKSLINELYIENERRYWQAFNAALGKSVPTLVDLYHVAPDDSLLAMLLASKQGGDTIVPIDAASGLPAHFLRNFVELSHTMIGRKRLDNIQYCIETVLADGIAGDVIETGIWRGGAIIFMRGVLAAYGVTDRTVWAADSFGGVPVPSLPEDQNFDISERVYPFLTVKLDQVKALMTKYDLLDDKVRFLPGWFKDTLQDAPIERLSVLRLDGDLYESTMDALNPLYAKVSPGGFIIVDDYFSCPPCMRAIDTFRIAHGITDACIQIDTQSMFWRKTGEVRGPGSVSAGGRGGDRKSSTVAEAGDAGRRGGKAPRRHTDGAGWNRGGGSNRTTGFGADTKIRNAVTAGALTAAIDAACASQTAAEGRLAATRFRKALRVNPRDAAAANELGVLAHRAGADEAARELFRQAIAFAPGHADYHSNLGIVLIRLRRFAEAEAAVRAAIRLQPGNFTAQANLGVALSELGRNDDAIAAYDAALRLQPGDPAVMCNRGAALQAECRYGEALASFEASLRGNPDDGNTQLALSNLLLILGRPGEAMAAFDAAIGERPAALPARQTRILSMNYLPGVGMADIGAVARRLAPQPAGPAYRPAPGFDRDPERRLRVGYVSADFYAHPVGFFLESVLAATDRAQTELVCYDNSFRAADAVTARLRLGADIWRPIAPLSDAAATDLIRADRIDILVDLSGHTGGNRLGVFANRAAPVQVAWLGYFGTTGVAAMDYILADRFVAPPGEEADFSETVIRLPDSYLCFTPPTEAGPVAPLPAGADGPITFGSFNNSAKLNPGVIALWSAVLASVPHARLLLKAVQYKNETMRREAAAAFAAHGIDAGRLLFEPAGSLAQMFAAYGQVDIALDPFPFAGGATTAMALWMGVPVVSLAAATWPGRQGASLLNAAGFPQLVAATPDSYVATARALAGDRAGLAAFRALLRPQMAASPLCDADRFARNLAAAFRDMWRQSLAAARA